MLSRVTAAAGRRAIDCARPLRPADLAGRPPRDSLRRAERRLGKAAGADWLAHWLPATPVLWQPREGSFCCSDGADRPIYVHDGAASLVPLCGWRSAYNKHSNKLQLVEKGRCRFVAKCSAGSSSDGNSLENNGQRAKTHRPSCGLCLPAHARFAAPGRRHHRTGAAPRRADDWPPSHLLEASQRSQICHDAKR